MNQCCNDTIKQCWSYGLCVCVFFFNLKKKDGYESVLLNKEKNHTKSPQQQKNKIKIIKIK